MIQRLRALFVSLCLFLVIPAFAQPTFTLQVVNNAVTGQTASLRLRVTGFTNIISAQFALCWDPQVLRFSGVSNLNLPNLQDSVHFSTSNVHLGVLGFAWPSPNIQTGTTVVDATTIFRLNFTVLGPLNTGSAVKFADKPPTLIEIGQVVNGVILEVPDSTITFNNGFVAVGYTVPASEPVSKEMDVNIAPNPFSDRTLIRFALPQPAEVNWYITDVAGRIVLKNKEFVHSGQHGMEIANTQLRGAGTYFFVAETAGFRTVRPLFLL